MFIWQNRTLARGERIARILPSAGLLTFVSSLIAAGCVSRRAEAVVAIMMLASILITGLGMISLRHFERRSRERIIAGDIDRCPSCSYCLSGLGSGGCCPECGARFTRTSLQRDWAIHYQLWDLANSLSRLGPRACYGCEYSLVGLEPTGLCPECGLPYAPQDPSADRDASPTPNEPRTQ